mmetsp:Transcript_2184/g.2278  ORF Transcript_2184/g.2278 Transcript_2184/m.2278 type:complete len:511 (-) Transcript_2184:102-1634(-)
MEAVLEFGREYIGLFFDTLESYSWIGVSTHVVHLDALDAQLLPVADGLGMQLPLIKYTLSLFLAYPFAAILRAIPDPNIKHFISMMGGIFLVQWVFGPDWIHSFISSAVTYLICAFVPNKYSVMIAFTWAMSYMTIAHGYRMWISYMSGIFDFTGMQMVLTMKLTSFAYNVYDGSYDKANVFKKYEDKKLARVYGDRKKFAIERFPNPLEFFGYIYCFTCILAGPAFEYNDYLHSIDGTKFKRPEGKPGKVPSSIIPALFRLFIGIVAMVLHLYMNSLVSITNIYNLDFIASHSVLYRAFYTYFVLMADRMKYYFAWKVAEGASVMGGFGFEGFNADGEAIGWKGVENIDILGFEFAPNVQILSRSWNKRTQGWLERYTYHRTKGSLMITYFVSAIWHGLYPGFFLFFMSIPLLTSVERLIKQKLNPIIVPGYDGYKDNTAPPGAVTFVYWQVSRIMLVLATSYCVQVFSLSSLERSLTALGSYHYIPHIAMFALYLFLSFMPSPKKKKE